MLAIRPVGANLENSSLSMPNNLVSEKPVELGRLIQVAYLVIILLAFAWAKELLLPLILAILISFLLAPVVSRLEHWRFPRAVAVLSVVAIGFALIGGLCSTLSLEGLDLVNSLPKYRDNIHARWAAIQQGPPGPLNLALSNVNALITDLGKVTASKGVQPPDATKVQIVSGANNVLAIVKNSLTPVAGPIGEFALIVVLVVFMLLERNRLRDRFLRLIGHSRIATTNLAVDGSSLETKFILLLTENRLSEAKALLQALGGMQLSVGIAEGLILPTLRAIENDLYPGTNATKSRIYAQLRELIEEMTVEGSTQLEPPPEPSTPKQPGTAIVPFMGEGDEIVGRVIARLLAAKGIDDSPHNFV